MISRFLKCIVLVFLISMSTTQALQNDDAPAPGKIIFLNGSSSSGKSTIASQLKKANPSYKIISIDDYTIKNIRDFFRQYEPEADHLLFQHFKEKYLLDLFNFLSAHRQRKWLEEIEDPILRTEVEIAAQKIRRLCRKKLTGVFLGLYLKTKNEINQEARKLSLEGHNVIIDHVVIERCALKRSVHELHDMPVYFIGVRAPIDVIEKREKQRGDREIGTARLVFNLTHAHGRYDLLVDTSKLNPEESAKAVQEFIENTQDPQAFHLLESRLDRTRVKMRYGLFTGSMYARVAGRIVSYKVRGII
jgi:chloramphenicol 3-O-phosphotransferase